MFAGEFLARYEELKEQAEAEGADTGALVHRLGALADEASGQSGSDAQAAAVLSRRLAFRLRSGVPDAETSDE